MILTRSAHTKVQLNPGFTKTLAQKRVQSDKTSIKCRKSFIKSMRKKDKII